MSQLQSILYRLICAACTGIYVLSDRRQAALQQIAQLCQQQTDETPAEPWRLATWNILDGLKIEGIDLDTLKASMKEQARKHAETQAYAAFVATRMRQYLDNGTSRQNAETQARASADGYEGKQAVRQAGEDAANDSRNDPDFADVQTVLQYLQLLAPVGGKGSTVLVLQNCEEDFDKRLFREAMEKALYVGKNSRTFIVPLCGTTNIPPQLRSKFRVVEHPMPRKAEIERKIRETAEGYDALPEDVSPIIGACGGMTEEQIESAIAETLVDLPQGQLISPLCIMESKREALASRGLILHDGKQTLRDVVGLANAKAKLNALLRSDFPADLKRLGELLVGVPGTGKTYLVGAAANENGWQMLQWNPNDMKGSLQGETEANWRAVRSVIEAQGSEGGRLILLVDEIEKLAVGMMDATSARSDGGVMAGIGGAFLSWLQDRKPGLEVVVFGTCNDMSLLTQASSGAFSRAGRFRGTLFFDFPTQEQRAAAWKMYRAKNSIPDSVAPLASDEGMTPAEIAATCEGFRVYQCKTLAEAVEDVPLVSQTASEAIAKLRRDADGRYVSADYPGKFRLTKTKATAPIAPPPATSRPAVRRPGKTTRPPDDGALFSGN